MQPQNIFLAAAALLASAVVGTNIHAATGCIVVNENPLCQSSPITIDSGSATFFAMFNNGDTTDPEVNAGCGLNATWPSYYGDIIFGPDNCLYDATGVTINGQCCRAGTGGEIVPNPYLAV